MSVGQQNPAGQQNENNLAFEAAVRRMIDEMIKERHLLI